MNIPKLRFREFNDIWKESKLGDFTNVLMCKRIFANQTSESYEVPFYKIGTIGGTPDTFISRELFEEYKSKYNYPRTGEILITCSGTVGKCIIFNGEDSYFQDSNIVWLDNPNNVVNNNFLYYVLSNVDWSRLNSTTIVRIYGDNLRQLKIKYPTEKEQIKIINTLSLLDKKIELQSKKIEDLKLFKKGLHDKLFNEVTGNDYLLSDIAVFENGKGHENIIDENGKYILINSKFISTEGNVTKKCSEQLTPLFKNDITMVMSDLPNGKALAKCYYIDENNKYSLNQRICKIKVKDDSIINSKYLFYLLNRNSYYLRFDDGVNQTNLKKDDILSLNLVLPSIKEQERDSKTLTIIDNFIEKENNKLSKLILLKKGLMQSMFV